jgi:hypothetical protein
MKCGASKASEGNSGKTLTCNGKFILNVNSKGPSAD